MRREEGGLACARSPGKITVRTLGRVDYVATWQAMVAFTATREPDTPDDIWVCEHPPVYTLGQAGKREHLLCDNGIALVAIDRGGQITYHGPGQVVVYLLLDLKRSGLAVRELVRRIEQAIIDFLKGHGVPAERLAGAPGVYVRQDGEIAKIGALGLRVRKNGCYHGLALNVDMDLAPFAYINPCGHKGMKVTQTRDLAIRLTPEQVAAALVCHLQQQLRQEQLEQQ